MRFLIGLSLPRHFECSEAGTKPQGGRCWNFWTSRKSGPTPRRDRVRRLNVPFDAGTSRSPASNGTFSRRIRSFYGSEQSGGKAQKVATGDMGLADLKDLRWACSKTTLLLPMMENEFIQIGTGERFGVRSGTRPSSRLRLLRVFPGDKSTCIFGNVIPPDATVIPLLHQKIQASQRPRIQTNCGWLTDTTGGGQREVPIDRKQCGRTHAKGTRIIFTQHNISFCQNKSYCHGAGAPRISLFHQQTNRTTSKNPATLPQ